MTTRSLSDEAKYCRQIAEDLEGAEKPFMISVANAFEELASRARRNATRTAQKVTTST